MLLPINITVAAMRFQLIWKSVLQYNDQLGGAVLDGDVVEGTRKPVISDHVMYAGLSFIQMEQGFDLHGMIG